MRIQSSLPSINTTYYIHHYCSFFVSAPFFGAGSPLSSRMAMMI